MHKSLTEVAVIPHPHHVTGCHIDAGEELQDKVLVISSKFPKMGFCSRIKL
ncbi:MAG: hypothetical protein N2489_02100 [Clostridia bacterium]|nr:hypothetical protein [Clostridia bacterium]